MALGIKKNVRQALASKFSACRLVAEKTGNAATGRWDAIETDFGTIELSGSTDFYFPKIYEVLSTTGTWETWQTVETPKATDDIETGATLYDFNATVLHLMGFDHERLTYYRNGTEDQPLLP